MENSGKQFRKHPQIINTIKKIVRIQNLFFVYSLLLTGTGVQAQMENQYTQYMMNTETVNPAYVGSREDCWTIFGLYRNQWLGIEGAPKIANISVSGRLNDRMGLGMSVVNDQIGAINETDISANFSYNITINDTYQLYFGIKGSANILNIDFNKLNIYDPNNPAYSTNVENQFSPNIGIGVYLKSEIAYVGLSIPYLLKTEHYKSENNSVVNENKLISLIGGYVFDLTDEIEFKPALLASYSKDIPLKLDVSANFLFNKKFMTGLGYRNSKTVNASLGFQVSEKIYLGYAYDWEMSDLQTANSGSHEVFLRFDLFSNDSCCYTKKFF